MRVLGMLIHFPDDLPSDNRYDHHGLQEMAMIPSCPSVLRVALIGCGGFSGAHVRRLRALPEVALAALCDSRPGQIDGLVGRRLADHPPLPRFTDLGRMLAEVRPDAVVVCIPHHLHRMAAEQAFTAGCHVLVEKPLATSAADAQALVEAASRAGRVLGVGFNTPSAPAFRWLADRLRDGTLGDLRLVSAVLGQDWRRLTAGTWRQDAAPNPGGQLDDSGAHLLAGILHLIGEDPVEVSVLGECRGTPVPVDGVLALRFPGGVLASLAIGGDAAADLAQGCWLGTAAVATIDPWNGSAATLTTRQGPQPVDLTAYPASDPTSDFIAAVRASRAPAADGRLGVRVAHLVERIRHALTA
jgi:predicted dehydrogenase